jgi:hypothetical protein
VGCELIHHRLNHTNCLTAYCAAVWFSRYLGQDADGNKRYAWLITFRVLGDAELFVEEIKASKPTRELTA